MARYLNSQIRKLRNELRYASEGASRLQVARIRELLSTLSGSGVYPYEFVVTRITGFQPQRSTPLELQGESLIPDLRRLLYDISGHARLRADEAKVKVLSLHEVCQRYGVSTRTIARWRENGLMSMKFIWPDGSKRTGFGQDDVGDYVKRNATSVARASRFSRITEEERRALVERAMFCVRERGMNISQVTQCLSDECGRSREAIRYTLLKHDRGNPLDPIFERWRESFTADQTSAMHEAFLSGTSVAQLARRYNRTPSAIYQILRLARARRLLAKPIEYVPNPALESKDADQEILGVNVVHEPSFVDPAGPPSGAPQTDRQEEGIYGPSPLSKEEERRLFLRYNYLKFKAARMRSRLIGAYASQRIMDQLEVLRRDAAGTREKIAQGYTRLVGAVARRHLQKGVSFHDLISEGNLCLLRAIEKFDVARNNRFSTYLTWALMKTYARVIPEGRGPLTNLEPDLLESAECSPEPVEDQEVQEELRKRTVAGLLTELSDREREVVASRFGLSGSGPASYIEIGRMLGVTRERARQIQQTAIRKLREKLGAERQK